ncbi:MAG TPA: DUF3300 domain-containing protein [Gemmatimonadaceae bacterium]|nr:DUF3300 domain-containing protein [Gemmatimonadaceae bacterium]
MRAALRVPVAFRWMLMLAAAALLPLTALIGQESEVSQGSGDLYTAEELDNLLAPVALYPDPILAQVLVAATYPEQVELAARYVRVNGTSNIDMQPWDISVRAVAHYAPVLNLMADRIDWTTALGQAHASQPGDVMASVQQLRSMARAQGNLVTTAEQEVVVEDRTIYIVPARPRVVYVPVYDPYVVYHRPIFHAGVYQRGWSFSVAFPIGVWLTYDVDWHQRHVYYHGWNNHRRGRGWYSRSRPYIVVNNIYVNRHYTTVVINRRVVDRRVNYHNVGRYDRVHRGVTWDRRRQYEDRRYADRGNRGRGNGGPSWDRGNRAPASAPVRVAKPRDEGPSWDRSRRTAQPARTEIARSTPARTQPNRAQPARTDIARSNPARTNPARTQPARTNPARTQPARTRPSRVATNQPRQAPRAEPRSAPRAEPRQAPRAAPRAEPRSAPRAEPRQGTQRTSEHRVARSGGRVVQSKAEKGNGRQKN